MVSGVVVSDVSDCETAGPGVLGSEYDACGPGFD